MTDLAAMAIVFSLVALALWLAWVAGKPTQAEATAAWLQAEAKWWANDPQSLLVRRPWEDS
jgi:hypothetical protein